MNVQIHLSYQSLLFNVCDTLPSNFVLVSINVTSNSSFATIDIAGTTNEELYIDIDLEDI